MEKELLCVPQPTTEVFNYTPEAWERIADDIAWIDLHAFSDANLERLTALRDKFSRSNFEQPELISVLLNSESGSVVGYSQAEQSWMQGSARIARTALAPEYQGKGLVGTLLDRMEAELKARGVTTITRKARIKNGYADAIRRHYGDRIVADYSDGIHSEEERCFVINL